MDMEGGGKHPPKGSRYHSAHGSRGASRAAVSEGQPFARGTQLQLVQQILLEIDSYNVTVTRGNRS